MRSCWRAIRRQALLAMGVSVAVLGGCDPAVRESLLGGVSASATSLAGTFIDAYFQTLVGPAPISLL